MRRGTSVFVALVATLLLAACGGEREAEPPAPANVAEPVEVAKPPKPAPKPPRAVERVALDTSEGRIVLRLDGKRAPITTANFLAYVDGGKFDGVFFYRAGRNKGNEEHGLIQGGIRRDYRRMLNPIEHEPTSKTGLRHEDGTISMARAEDGMAMGDFFITVGPSPSMDAKGDEPGYAAFGKVSEGMDVVRRILAKPTIANAGRGAMKGQMIEEPVRIEKAERVE